MKFEETRQKALENWAAFESPSQMRILVGSGTCGRAAGSLQIIEQLRAWIDRTDADADIYEVGCLGMCYAETLLDIWWPDGPRVLYGNLTPHNIGGFIENCIVGNEPFKQHAIAVITGHPAHAHDIPLFKDLPMLKGQVRFALRNCGWIDPLNIDHYIGRGGYEGLQKALRVTSAEVVEEIKRSGLKGRGGAGFPTGMKWELCARQPGNEKYLICNADEGDPGAFMDRSVLESDPHSVLEGMVIAGYAIGAHQGYIYARAEYPLAILQLEKGIQAMREYGLLGKNILESGFDFDISIKEGAGAFVCGEETALIASIEGKRGMPRPRPPYPAVSGLFGKPTNINNVETFANVSAILSAGSNEYAKFGTEKSKGTKTFALAGKISRTGLIEVPLGITLKEIIFDIGGGIPGGKKIKAIQTGGPSGGCLPATLLDLKVDYENLAQAGSIMGSGGMIVMDEDTCIVDIARYFLEFTKAESCGKCIPCRVGTAELLLALENICAGRGNLSNIAFLEELGKNVKAASLCGLGQTAPNPVLTTLRYFMDEYLEHIDLKKCKAGVCKALISFEILEKCLGCGACKKACPVNAISGERKQRHSIDQALCTKCGTCYETCKFESIQRN